MLPVSLQGGLNNVKTTDASSTVNDDITREATATDEIIRRLGVELDKRGSALFSDGKLDAEFIRQSRSILAEAFDALRTGASSESLISVEYGAPDALRTAQIRASQNLHPAEGLMAAEALFGVALPLVADAVRQDGVVDTVAVAQTLHHAVWRRFPPGAIAYVEVLRARLAETNRESRNSVARELHDRVAHGIAAGIQRIELECAGEETSASTNIIDATRILRAALEDVQNIAFDLRQRVGDAFLDDAIRDYVENAGTLAPPIRFVSTGKRAVLASSVAEEAFTIVLEAIRNARTHAPTATEIVVSTSWRPTALVVEITDDGPGFDPDRTQGGSFGIVGMRERAATIGARFDIRSIPAGTRVTLTIPLAKPRSA